MVIIWPLGPFSKIEENKKEATDPNKQSKGQSAFPRHSWVWWGSVGTQALDCLRLCSPQSLTANFHRCHLTYWALQHGKPRLPEWGIRSQSQSELSTGGILRFTDGKACGHTLRYFGIKPFEILKATWPGCLWMLSVIGVSVSVFITLLIPNPTCVTLCGRLLKCSLGLRQGTCASFEYTCYPLSEWGKPLEIPLKPHFSYGWSWKLQLYALCFPGITELKSKASDCI